MKHPNRKAEASNKWLCEFHKQIRKSREQSCFNWWFNNSSKPAEFIQMTNDGLLNALIKTRQGGKTIKVELADL